MIWMSKVSVQMSKLIPAELGPPPVSLQRDIRAVKCPKPKEGGVGRAGCAPAGLVSKGLVGRVVVQSGPKLVILSPEGAGGTMWVEGYDVGGSQSDSCPGNLVG